MTPLEWTMPSSRKRASVTDRFGKFRLLPDQFELVAQPRLERIDTFFLKLPKAAVPFNA